MSVAFHTFLSSSVKRRLLYTKIAPILTDVTLRDGLQYASIIDYGTVQKKDLFHTILFQENPPNMEVGALTSYKTLPIMADSLDIHKYVSSGEWSMERDLMVDLFANGNSTIPLNTDHPDKRYFMLISALKKLPLALDSGVKHLAFSTSVSEIFQKRNMNRSLTETKTEFTNMFLEYPVLHSLYTKLYISCIRECPLQGKIDIDWIVKEILYYHTHYPFREICLADTCGTLTLEDFKYIVETIKIFGFPYSKLSLHLHVDKENLTNIKSILYYCFTSGIRQFDVSLLNTGGCPVLEKSCSNLSYNDFYEMLKTYIEMKE